MAESFSSSQTNADNNDTAEVEEYKLALEKAERKLRFASQKEKKAKKVVLTATQDLEEACAKIEDAEIAANEAFILTNKAKEDAVEASIVTMNAARALEELENEKLNKDSTLSLLSGKK